MQDGSHDQRVELFVLLDNTRMFASLTAQKALNLLHVSLASIKSL
jgi:hypothetical protein